MSANKTFKTRTICTNLCGNVAMEVLESVRGQLSDGIWENSRAAEKYWMNFSVQRLPTNQVAFVVNAESTALLPTYRSGSSSRFIENPFIGLSDNEFLAWIARKLKAVVSTEAKDGKWPKGWWKRDNSESKSRYLGYGLSGKITIAEVYCIYDELLGRKCRASEQVKQAVFSSPLSEEETAKRAEFAIKSADCMRKYEARLAELERKLEDLTAKVAADKAEARREFEAELAALKAEYTEARS